MNVTLAVPADPSTGQMEACIVCCPSAMFPQD